MTRLGWLVIVSLLFAPIAGLTMQAYDPGQRPDPFADPRAALPSVEPHRPPGLVGKDIAELKLSGLTLVGETPIAILTGNDGKGLFAREGAELWDGRVSIIDFDKLEVVFEQKLAQPEPGSRIRDVVMRLIP